MVKIAAVPAGNNGDSFLGLDGGFLLVPFLTSLSQLPVYLPPALAWIWMALRFEDITLYAFAWQDIKADYIFVLLSLYIALRLCFGRVKKFLPLLAHTKKIRAAKRRRAR